jgi:metacaspase-1
MNKRALIIGINNYRDINPLRGCVNDTTNLRLILKDVAGIDADQIRMLVDARATKAAIEQRIQWLVKDAAEGDLLVLHFSGHGSQIRDRGEQDELRERLDEILCPWDMDWDATFINDDYLDSVLEVPEGVVLEVILDCCNSGDTGVEPGFAGSGPALDANPDRRPRFAQPPVDIVSRHEGRGLPQRKLLERREPSRLALWSACGGSQTAADARIDGIPNGAFTFYFCKHLRDAPGALTRAELLERVKSSLRQAGHAQVPELTAPPDFLHEQPFTPRRRLV